MYLDNNTDLGKQVSAQTLAKIAITQDPNITFPGQRVSCQDIKQFLAHLSHRLTR